MRLVHVDRLRWILVSKRLLKDITIKAYDYEFFNLSQDCDSPFNPKIRSLLNLILSPIVFKELPVWGFVKSICIELTNTSLPLDLDLSYTWFEILVHRMQEIESLGLIGFTWNPCLIKLINNLCLQNIYSLDLDILLVQKQDSVEWDDLFQELFRNASQTVDHLSMSSCTDSMNPIILLQLFEIKNWKSISIFWKSEMDSGIFQLLLSKLIAWINYNTNLESCKIETFLPRMMENVTIPIDSLRNDGFFVNTSVDSISKKFSFLIVNERIQKPRIIRRSLCISSTTKLIPSDSCWTDEDGCGIIFLYST